MHVRIANPRWRGKRSRHSRHSVSNLLLNPFSGTNCHLLEIPLLADNDTGLNSHAALRYHALPTSLNKSMSPQKQTGRSKQRTAPPYAQRVQYVISIEVYWHTDLCFTFLLVWNQYVYNKSRRSSCFFVIKKWLVFTHHQHLFLRRLPRNYLCI